MRWRDAASVVDIRCAHADHGQSVEKSLVRADEAQRTRFEAHALSVAGDIAAIWKYTKRREAAVHEGLSLAGPTGSNPRPPA